MCINTQSLAAGWTKQDTKSSFSDISQNTTCRLTVIELYGNLCVSVEMGLKIYSDFYLSYNNEQTKIGLN